MRTVPVEINGKEYPAAYTVRVLANLEDRAGGKPAAEALEELLGSGKVRDAAWLLSQLLVAGEKIAQTGETPPSEAELLDLIPGDAAFALTAAALQATRGIAPRVKLEDQPDPPEAAQ